MGGEENQEESFRGHKGGGGKNALEYHLRYTYMNMA